MVEGTTRKTSEFRVWWSGLCRLSRSQREAVEEALGCALSQSPLESLESAHGSDACCPRCAAPKPYRRGHQARMQRYRCRQYGHTFTLLSPTPLARLRYKESWLTYSEALVDGLTVRAAARRCALHKNTSFRWRHRFLQLPAATKAEHLQGIAEADETYIPDSCKGQRHLARPPRQRGHAIHEPGTGPDQVPVLILRDRSGATADFKLTAANTANIEPPLRALLAPDAILCSDGASVYRAAAQHLHLTHRPINL